MQTDRQTDDRDGHDHNHNTDDDNKYDTLLYEDENETDRQTDGEKERAPLWIHVKHERIKQILKESRTRYYLGTLVKNRNKLECPCLWKKRARLKTITNQKLMNRIVHVAILSWPRLRVAYDFFVF